MKRKNRPPPLVLAGREPQESASCSLPQPQEMQPQASRVPCPPMPSCLAYVSPQRPEGALPTACLPVVPQPYTCRLDVEMQALPHGEGFVVSPRTRLVVGGWYKPCRHCSRYTGHSMLNLQHYEEPCCRQCAEEYLKEDARLCLLNLPTRHQKKSGRVEPVQEQAMKTFYTGPTARYAPYHHGPYHHGYPHMLPNGRPTYPPHCHQYTGMPADLPIHPQWHPTLPPHYPPGAYTNPNFGMPPQFPPSSNFHSHQQRGMAYMEMREEPTDPSSHLHSRKRRAQENDVTPDMENNMESAAEQRPAAKRARTQPVVGQALANQQQSRKPYAGQTGDMSHTENSMQPAKPDAKRARVQAMPNPPVAEQQQKPQPRKTLTNSVKENRALYARIKLRMEDEMTPEEEASAAQIIAFLDNEHRDMLQTCRSND